MGTAKQGTRCAWRETTFWCAGLTPERAAQVGVAAYSSEQMHQISQRSMARMYDERCERGLGTPPRKLTSAQVRELRGKRVAGATYAALGQEYGIHEVSARKICLRERYRDVA